MWQIRKHKSSTNPGSAHSCHLQRSTKLQKVEEIKKPGIEQSLTYRQNNQQTKPLKHTSKRTKNLHSTHPVGEKPANQNTNRKPNPLAFLAVHINQMSMNLVPVYAYATSHPNEDRKIALIQIPTKSRDSSSPCDIADRVIWPAFFSMPMIVCLVLRVTVLSMSFFCQWISLRAKYRFGCQSLLDKWRKERTLHMRAKMISTLVHYSPGL